MPEKQNRTRAALTAALICLPLTAFLLLLTIERPARAAADVQGQKNVLRPSTEWLPTANSQLPPTTSLISSTVVAADDTFTTPEDIVLQVPAPGVMGNDIDTEGNSLTATLLNDPITGTLSFSSDGSFEYTPPSNWFGTVTFTYQISNGMEGHIADYQKISNSSGSCSSDLDPYDRFSYSTTNLGDLDGDGVVDLAVGAQQDDDGGTDRGAVYILFINKDGTLKNLQKISQTQGGFGGSLDDYDWFGTSVVNLGDLDGDSVVDLAVGTEGDDDGGSANGAVWILFLNADGTVKGEQKISENTGGLNGSLDGSSHFGRSATNLGDMDGDEVTDIAIGAGLDDDGGINRGAVWILFLNSNGTVKAEQKISQTQGGFGGTLNNYGSFGGAVEQLGDLDGDNVTDLAVGAHHDSDASNDLGAVWILFLNSDGTVKDEQKINDTQGGFGGTVNDGDHFGQSLANMGEFAGPGTFTLAVAATGDDDGGTDRGALWLLQLTISGTVSSEQKISSTIGGFGDVTENNDRFSNAIEVIGDLNGDGVIDLAVGSVHDANNSLDRGTLWILFLNSDGSVKGWQKIAGIECGGSLILDDNAWFGRSAAGLGDLDGDGIGDMAVGANHASGGGDSRGSVFVLFMNIDGTVKGHQKIDSINGGFNGDLADNDRFGTALANLGDLDGDGVIDLAVGANLDDDGSIDSGAVWILFLNSDGTVKNWQKISETQGGFTDNLGADDRFGESVENMGDLNDDGVIDLAVGAPRNNDGGTDRGAVWVLFLNNDGTVKSHQKISSSQGDFAGPLDNWDYFGTALVNLGDLDGDDIQDMVVGATRDDDGGTDRGAVWFLFLNSDGTVKGETKISDTVGGFNGTLNNSDLFGQSADNLGDVDGNGVVDLAVGANRDDDGNVDNGAVWILFLNQDGTVASEKKISETAGGFTGELDSEDWFGVHVANVNDLNGDGIVDLAVGAMGDDDGGTDRGAAYVLFLQPPGVATATVTITVTPVNDPLTITSALVDSPVNENDTITASGTFTDVDFTDTFTLTVDWGDGTSPEQSHYGTGVRDFSESHQYLDDDPSHTPSDVYTITLTMEDSGGSSDTLTRTTTVNNLDPALDGLLATPLNITETQTISLTGFITDIGSLDTFTLTVNWSDGSLEDYHFPGTGAFLVSHTYQDDGLLALLGDRTPFNEFAISASVVDDDNGLSPTSWLTVTVDNSPPTLSGLAAAAISETETAVVSGNIDEISPLDTFTLVIDWGDGTNDSYNYSAGTTFFSEEHIYPDDNPTGTPADVYTLTLVLTDDDGGVAVEQMGLTVSNVAPDLANVSVAPTAIDEDGTATLSGDINEINPLDSFSLEVDWGDGDVETFNFPAGSTGFSESHQYLDDNPSSTSADVYTITLTLSDDDGGMDDTAVQLTVNNIAPQVNAGPDQTVLLGQNVQFNGTFHDTGTLDTHTILWDFGDGQTAAGTLNPSHTYSAPGIYAVTLTITDDDLGVGIDELVIVVEYRLYLPLVLLD